MVGPITPKSFARHDYILVVTNYFSKRAEVVPLKELKKENVVNFIRSNIIYRYGVPWYIITDNGKPFYIKLMSNLYERFGFKQHNSSMYNAPTNGLTEAFNKTLCNLLKKVVDKSKEGLAWTSRRSSLGILNNILNAYTRNPLFPRLWCRSCIVHWASDPFIKDCYTWMTN